MKYNITNTDRDTLLQSDLHYRYRVYLLKNGRVMDTLTGIIDIGNYSVDSTSDVRRTLSITMQPDTQPKAVWKMEQKIQSLLGYDLQFQIGIFHIREEEYIWYE